MNRTRKVAIGIGIAGGALLAAWLLTGDRRRKTKAFISRSANDVKKTFQKKELSVADDSEMYYV